jgi:flagellar basal-body rod protein FlgC
MPARSRAARPRRTARSSRCSAEYDKATGLSTVNVEQIVTAGGEPTKLYDPTHPLADKDGNVYVSAVDETRELVDMMETSRTYQNNVEVMQTAKSLILDTLKLGH